MDILGEMSTEKTVGSRWRDYRDAAASQGVLVATRAGKTSKRFSLREPEGEWLRQYPNLSQVTLLV